MSEYLATSGTRTPSAEGRDRALHRMVYSFPRWRKDERGKIYVALPGSPSEIDVLLGGLVVALNIEYDTSKPLVVTVDAPIARTEAVPHGQGTEAT